MRNFGRENGKFPVKIVISEILVRGNVFRPPQTRRQISAAQRMARREARSLKQAYRDQSSKMGHNQVQVARQDSSADIQYEMRLETRSQCRTSRRNRGIFEDMTIGQ